jgi:uracil phosphoribosyltransferase
MLINLSEANSILGQFVAEIRDVEVQNDRLRFRRNMERIGEIMAYEISKKLKFTQKKIKTPLGYAFANVPAEKLLLATILRAGLPLHQGMLNYFDDADNAFISAYRNPTGKHSFEIKLEYCSSPSLENRILIVSDPMLATGASMALTIKELFSLGTPKEIHVVSAIACKVGIEKVQSEIPNAIIWAADVDADLNEKAYIVPGLGDAGDLAYGSKGSLD